MRRLVICLLCWLMVLSANEQSSHGSHHHMQRVELDYVLKTYGKNQVREIHLTDVSIDSLAHALDDTVSYSGYNTSKPMFLSVKFSNKPKLNESVSTIIDHVMSPRLLWTIKSFIFASNKDDHESLESILLTRASPILETSLNVLIQKNYPSLSTICEKRPLHVVNFRGDTWGNRAKNIMYFMEASSQFVTYVSATETGIANEKSSYALPSECPGRVNRYECLFLPSTNCTLPTRLTTGTQPPEAKELGLSELSKLLYDRTAADGKLLDNKKLSEYRTTIFKDLPEYKIDSLVQKNHSFKYNFDSGFYIRTRHALNLDTSLTSTQMLSPSYRSSDHIVGLSMKDNTEGFVQAPHIVKQLFGYIHRYNTEFRLRVQNIVNRYRASTEPHFTPDLNCVMVHIRKDDRTPKDTTDIVSWCKNHLKYNKKTFDEWSPVGVSDTDIHNYGCNLILPYAAATLEHFLNASLIMAPENKNIFIATDDQAWLHQAIKEYHQHPHNLIHEKQLKLFPFHPRHNHRQDDSMDSAAEFFATIELGRQCNLGFVGYTMSSAVAQLFYQSLCYFNRYEYLSCPALFEFGVNVF